MLTSAGLSLKFNQLEEEVRVFLKRIEYEELYEESMQ